MLVSILSIQHVSEAATKFCQLGPRLGWTRLSICKIPYIPLRNIFSKVQDTIGVCVSDDTGREKFVRRGSAVVHVALNLLLSMLNHTCH